MKKVILLVPDKINVLLGSSIHTTVSEKDVTAETMVNALTTLEYHEAYFFDKKDVTVLSIEKTSDS